MFVRVAAIAAVLAASASVDARSSRFKGLLRSDDETARRGLKTATTSKSRRSKGTKPMCLSYGEKAKVKGTDVVTTGEGQFLAECNMLQATWDSDACAYYEEPFWVNRDVGITTSFVYDDGTHYSFGATPDNEPPLGDGALCGAVSSTSDDKLILEYFGDVDAARADPTDPDALDLQNRHLKHLQNMKYSFWVETCPTAGSSPCPNEFYLNVYARKNATRATDPNPWYDCRFDFVPTQGGTVRTWTTFDLYDIKNIPVAQTGTTGGSTCHGATTIQEYIDAVTTTDGTDAVLGNFYYTFAWNIGDSAAPDAGVSGCYDNVQIDLNDETATRVYDFEN